jgi:hypothetical protein
MCGFTSRIQTARPNNVPPNCCHASVLAAPLLKN